MNILNLIKRDAVAKFLTFAFIALAIFWVWIQTTGSQQGMLNNSFGAAYPLISLIGGLYGLFSVSKQWGGFKSLIGKGIIFLSLGLLAEVFGQWAWSYFTIIQNIEVPYPSIADLGYFMIVPFYAYAMYNFARASGIKLGLKNTVGKAQAIVIPLLMVSVAFWLFLRDVEVDPSNYLRAFLDFGYPGLEAIAISIGILTYTLSRGVLGGVMRSKVLFIVFALAAQYVTDYLFLYQVGTEVYYNAGIVDLMYTISVFLMALGIISLKYPQEANA